jgi:heterodisulfide reductase subunit B
MSYHDVLETRNLQNMSTLNTTSGSGYTCTYIGGYSSEKNTKIIDNIINKIKVPPDNTKNNIIEIVTKCTFSKPKTKTKTKDKKGGSEYIVSVYDKTDKPFTVPSQEKFGTIKDSIVDYINFIHI